MANITGKTFNFLTALRLVDPNKKIWECMCSCGKTVNVFESNLTRGHTKSCGCYNRMALTNRRYNLEGMTFGRLTVLERIGMRNRMYLWKCKCECGNYTEVVTAKLISGHTRSCGCLQRDAVSWRSRMWPHGPSPTKKYFTEDEQRLRTVLNMMRARCYNPKSSSYRLYGARGITVCDEWINSPETFVKWGIANGYRKGLSIDRIDNNKGYSPENCRWATPSEQNANRRSNVRITVDGVDDILSNWSRKTGIERNKLSRLFHKDEEAVTNVIKSALHH